MRDAFVKTLVELAKQDKNIELITGDLGFGVLKPFWEQCPDQFTNAGIAEQNMASLAGGMALCGKNIFTYSIGNFPTLRCLEQIRNDVAYLNSNVKIVCVGGGFSYGSLGMSHQATEDIAIMRALPNMVVMAPADLAEAEECTKALANYKGCAYLRLGRGGEKRIHQTITGFEIGKALRIFDGKDIAVLSCGAIAEEAYDAVELLKKDGFNPAFYTFPTIKPIDKELLQILAKQFKLIVTCEEHNLSGGFGSAVLEALEDVPLDERKTTVLRIGISDIYCSAVGDQKYLRKYTHIDADSIHERIVNKIESL